ncbi:hypothetical protein BKA56DRAFT_81496 [Ilyonectria sp. MPI-CAGE-AT-0026]|nr:hypothetical protein BKA56DRAFT_81496 [Ilyonectria sp. MPI-CAGE-AT-0026]
MDENPATQNVSQQGLRGFFLELTQHAKLFTSSRPDQSMRFVLPTEDGGSIRVVIPSTSNEDDISRFLHEGLSTLEWDQQTTALVHQRLATGAKGMFLWAKLMLHHVREQVTLYDLTRALDELPDGLDNVYARILGAISKLPKAQANKVTKALQWVYSSTRPLTLSEMKIAMAVEPGSSSLDGRRCLVNIHHFIATACAPLLVIHDPTETVRFAHASAFQYFHKLSSSPATELAIDDHLRLTLAQRVPYLAAVCFTYLAYDDIAYVDVGTSMDDYARNMEQHLGEHEFLGYSVLNLWEHLPACDAAVTRAPDSDLDKSLARFFGAERGLVK